jgi:hypothetical protein
MINLDAASLCGTVECDETGTGGIWRGHWLGIGHYAAHKGLIRVFMQCGGKVRVEIINWVGQKALVGLVKKPTAPETEMIMTHGFPLSLA